ncbi:hypothetical protein Sme01_37070 [Sphaerisporangium melleum]|uniref:Uncharacterized protein n=1 Tax=Sphaerisporangium melleum TaxID=321316 RepID=A0A917RBN9_9ACTN|nr:hypothetical protein GCM10007964_48010 [Sphaerisporangium melleum]GII71231.1 hypothetical protein Sme01_37070 [Sphaerisporangium melleum]
MVLIGFLPIRAYGNPPCPSGSAIFGLSSRKTAANEDQPLHQAQAARISVSVRCASAGLAGGGAPDAATGAGNQEQVTSTIDTTVQRTRALSLAATGSLGDEAVRVAVKV